MDMLPLEEGADLSGEGEEPSVPAPSRSGILTACASPSVSSRWKSWYLEVGHSPSGRGSVGRGRGTTGGRVDSLHCTARGLLSEGIAGEELPTEPDTAHGVLVCREWRSTVGGLTS